MKTFNIINAILAILAVSLIAVVVASCSPTPPATVATAAPETLHPPDPNPPPPICGMTEKDMLKAYGGGYKLNPIQFRAMAIWTERQNDGELPGHTAYVVRDKGAFMVVFVEEGCAVLTIAPFSPAELNSIFGAGQDT